MKIKQYIGNELIANTYLLYKDDVDWVWLVDAGEIDKILDFINGKAIKGVFITHSHFDHIYDLNKLIDNFPQCKIYTSKSGRDKLRSAKSNLSYYHGEPIEYIRGNIEVLNDFDEIELFEDCYMKVLETPGHDTSCLTYEVDSKVFTGDSFIPNLTIVTKLPGGSRKDNEKSLKKIFNLINGNVDIFPGHGNTIRGNNVQK